MYNYADKSFEKKGVLRITSKGENSHQILYCSKPQPKLECTEKSIPHSRPQSLSRSSNPSLISPIQTKLQEGCQIKCIRLCCVIKLLLHHLHTVVPWISCREQSYQTGPFFNGYSELLCVPFYLASPFQCGTIDDEGPNEGLTERSLQDAQRLYLMNDVVQPESVDPLVMQDDVRFSNLVVDNVQGMDTLYHVMYISTG